MQGHNNNDNTIMRKHKLVNVMILPETRKKLNIFQKQLEDKYGGYFTHNKIISKGIDLYKEKEGIKYE